MQNNITDMKHIRDTIYMTKEKITLRGGIEVDFEYLVDMELGICSCSTGTNGAACKYQAAIAKKFQIACLNIAPMHSKEARHTFAIIARGVQYTRNIEFYVDLQESNSEKTNFTMTITNSSDVQKYSNATKDSQDVNNDGNEYSNEIPENYSVTARDSQDVNNEWEAQVLLYKTSLMDIVEDLTKRLMEGDHNLLSGINKFINSYKQMENSQAPNSALSYALSDSE